MLVGKIKERIELIPAQCFMLRMSSILLAAISEIWISPWVKRKHNSPGHLLYLD